MTVLATGNNLRLKGDVTRRALVARLDSQDERPEHRKFNQDVLAEAGGNRWNLIHAVLTIVLAYRAAGSPNVADPIGSFEVWDRTVRSPLIWAGCGDPVATIERVREDDPVLGDLKAMMTIWYDAFGAEKMTIADVLRRVTPPDNPLYEALEGIAREQGLINRRRLGHYLRRHMDRIVDGLRIESAGERRSGTVWRVVRT
jgi:putative DNA primase/helicase